MKSAILALLIFLSANSFGGEMTQRFFGENGYQKVFFYVAQTGESVHGSSAIRIGSGEIYELLVDVAQKPNNFIGFIDKGNTTIQFMVEEFDRILVDIPSEKDLGSYRNHINNEEFIQLVNYLSEPYTKYIKDLNLKLVKW